MAPQTFGTCLIRTKQNEGEKARRDSQPHGLLKDETRNAGEETDRRSGKKAFSGSGGSGGSGGGSRAAD